MPGEWAGEATRAVWISDGKTAYVSIPLRETCPRSGSGDVQAKREDRVTILFVRSMDTNDAAGGTRESTSADPHGVALNGDDTKLYITLEFADVPGVAVYDVKAGKVIKKIDTVVSGNWLGVHPSTGKLYLPTRNHADKVVVIDTKTDQVVRVISLQRGSRPAGVAFGGPNHEVWINGDGDGSITIIDSATDKVIQGPPAQGQRRRTRRGLARWPPCRFGSGQRSLESLTRVRRRSWRLCRSAQPEWKAVTGTRCSRPTATRCT